LTVVYGACFPAPTPTNEAGAPCAAGRTPKGAFAVISRLRYVLLSLVLLCALLANQALAASARAHRATRQAALGVRAVLFARHLIGVRYRWGGTSPSTGFDCSGFVQFVYRHYGIHLPRTTYSQFDTGRRVSRNALRPGDLVFFDGVGHVGMYIGGGRFIHAPHAGTSVEISSLSDSWYAGTFDGARRFFAAASRRPHRVVKAVATGRIPVAWPPLRRG
jgi:NlpC/P60 family protein